MSKKISQYRVNSFMSNVNKLDMYVHRQTHDENFGTVKLVKSASENNGKRKFSVKNSIIRSGSYSYAGLKAKLLDAIK